MDREAIREELSAIVSGYLQERGLELVEIIHRYEGSNLYLRILADRLGGGITVADCASINNDISRILDERDLLQQRYILEVASPGLDRPLKTKNDFLRCIDRQVRVFLNDAIGGRLELDGSVSKVEGDTLFISSGDNSIEIPFPKIIKAKQVV